MRLTKRATITHRSETPDAADDSPVSKPRYPVTSRHTLVTPLRVLAVSVLALGLANCSSAPRNKPVASSAPAPAKVDPKYGVKPSPRVVAGSSKVPKGGGRAMVGKPYVVAGKRFTPQENENYVAVGTASWYGAAFHGRKTANGEVFDKHSFAAAHPTLPLPSYVRVTNLTNQRSMIVRVNDRGPFHGNRLIDLSKNAAEALDFHRQGTARVKVEYVGRASLTGSDDRKLLATLNADAPAIVPSAPATTPSAPVVTPAPVMVASAEPAPAPAPAPAPQPAVAQAPAERSTARTLVARPAEPPVAVPAQVAALPQPQPVAPPAARTLVAPPAQTLAFADTPRQATAGGSPLTDLVREVQAPPAPEAAQANQALQVVAAPLPPSRPAELARRRTLISAPAAGETLQGAQAPAAHGRRALVANLAEPAPADPGKGSDRAGVYFEPMPLSQLTPQRFVAFGNGSDRQSGSR